MKRLLKFAAALAALLVAAFVGLSFFFDANRFRPLLEQQMSQALARAVTIGNIELALFSGGVQAADLAIAEDPAFGPQPFLAARSIRIGVDLGALIFSRILHVRSITIDGAEVSLIQAEGGDWNFSSLGRAPSTAAPAANAPEPVPAADESAIDLAISLVRISNSTLHLASGKARHEFRDLAFELRDFSPAASMPFTLSANGAGAGNLKLTGKAGPIAKPDASATPFDTAIEITGLDLAASGFTEPATGIGGLLTVRGNANSNGQTAAVTGAVTIDRLTLAPNAQPATLPVGINLALAHDLKTRRGNIARSSLKLGGASATIAGSYDISRDVPAIDLKIDGPNLPLPDLMTFLPALDVELPPGLSVDGGTASLALASRGSTANLNTTGSVKVEQTRLNYNLGAKLRVIGQLADIPTDPTTAVSLLAAEFQTNRAGSEVRNIQFIAPAIGQLTGEGTVDPRHQIDFTMKAVVKTGGLVAAALKQRGETTTVPFFIRGASTDPQFSPDVKAIANEKLQQAIRNPEGAVKNVTETVKGVLDLFKKAPKDPGATK